MTTAPCGGQQTDLLISAVDIPRYFSYTRDVKAQAEQYLNGVIQAKKKNMERMAEAVPNSDDQSLQNLLTYSPWNENSVIDQVAFDANSHIGGNDDSCLIIDETGIPKKGEKSVGVSRQWCGQLGKTENCQVGVSYNIDHQIRLMAQADNR